MPKGIFSPFSDSAKVLRTSATHHRWCHAVAECGFAWFLLHVAGRSTSQRGIQTFGKDVDNSEAGTRSVGFGGMGKTLGDLEAL